MRHIMEPDPKREPPKLVHVLWLYALILAFVLFLVYVHAHS